MDIINKIMEYETVYIAGHINPDGDSVGACFAVAGIVSGLGKKPVVLLEAYSDKYGFLTGGEFVFRGDINGLPPSLFIALDTSDIERLGKSKELFSRCADTIVIDHHISNPAYAKLNCIEADASSTCEVVYWLFSPHITITKPIAEALYAGIIYDTGSFRHSATSRETHIAAAELLKAGVDFIKAQREILYVHTEAETRAFGKAVANIKYAANGVIAYTSLTRGELTECGAKITDLDGIVDYLINIRGVSAAVFFTERGEGIVKASIRSTDIDVALFASRYGGGGHERAAGANLRGNIDDCVSMVIHDLENTLNIS